MNQNCTKCGSDRVMSEARFESLIAGDGHINVHIYKKPDALFFKGTLKSELRAHVCGSCGYVETYIKNPGEIWDTYKVVLEEK